MYNYNVNGIENYDNDNYNNLYQEQEMRNNLFLS